MKYGELVELLVRDGEEPDQELVESDEVVEEEMQDDEVQEVIDNSDDSDDEDASDKADLAEALGAGIRRRNKPKEDDDSDKEPLI